MNIFYLHHNPFLAAQYHCDKHVIKMILESAQMLSTAHRVLDGYITMSPKKRFNLDEPRDSILYSATHINHPSAIWCRENSANYRWLFNLYLALCEEYSHRYHKIHKSSELMGLLVNLPLSIERSDTMSKMALAMPDQYKTDDPIESYRNYYIGEKSRMLKWTKRNIPEFCEGVL